MKINFTNSDFLYATDKDPISAGIHVFSSVVRGKRQNINWSYSRNYLNNLPLTQADPRDFHHQFENWIRNCEKWVIKGSLVIDIGGFTGDTAIPLAFLAGDEGRVLVFEPHPFNFSELERNLALNPCVNIDAYNLAIMKKEGSFDFLYQTDCHGAKNGGPSGDGLWTTETRAYNEKLTVNGITLEKVLENYPDKKISFIKIDTEGYDGDIIINIGDIINKHRPVILTEWLPGAEKKLLFILEHFKYRAFNPDSLVEVEIGANTRVQDILLLPQ